MSHPFPPSPAGAPLGAAAAATALPKQHFVTCIVFYNVKFLCVIRLYCYCMSR